MKIGDLVRVEKCEACPKVVGKTAKVKQLFVDENRVELQYGRGRPQTNRPNVMGIENVSIVE